MLIDFHIRYAMIVEAANFSDPVVANEMKNDPNPTILSNFMKIYFLGNGVTAYTDVAGEFLMITFYSDMIAFFTLVEMIIEGKAIGFMIIFTAIYLWIFISFFSTLREEIWLTHEILKLIPMLILEKNLKVREEVLKRKSYQ